MARATNKTISWSYATYRGTAVDNGYNNNDNNK